MREEKNNIYVFFNILIGTIVYEEEDEEEDDGGFDDDADKDADELTSIGSKKVLIASLCESAWRFFLI